MLVLALSWGGRANGGEFVDGFDYPVGAPDAYGYGITGWQYLEWEAAYGLYHTGEDWNGWAGGNTDWGDPVYAIANGVVTAAGNYGPGWGNIIVVEHEFPDGTVVWSRYAHEHDMYVSVGDEVDRGDVIGTIGCGYYYGDGVYDYWAHLHFDIMVVWQPAGAFSRGWTWEEVASVYANPSVFIEANRVVEQPCVAAPEEPIALDIVFPRNKVDHTYFRSLFSTGSDFVGSGISQSIARVGEWYAGDFTGDGLDDLALVQPIDDDTYEWWVWENNGTGRFINGGRWTTDFGNAGDRFLTGDFNGDGLDDIALIRSLDNGQVKLRVMPSFGHTFDDSSVWADYFGDSTGAFHAGDVDGDGRDDIVMAWGRTASVLEWWVAHSTGRSFRGPRTGQWNADNGDAGDFSLIGDFNGDGLVDSANGRIKSESIIKWRIGLSTGDGFESAVEWIDDFGGINATFYAGDVDKDGDDDLIFSAPRDGVRDVIWRVTKSNGSAFGRRLTWERDFGRADTVMLTGEFIP